MKDTEEFPIIDPDYQINKSSSNTLETEDSFTRRVKNIISNEFEKELFDRQNQIEHIETQICKVQKLLHLVRYTVIKSYYNRPELEYNQADEELREFSESGGQKRLHPAVKKILGANSMGNISDHQNLRKSVKRQNMSPKASHSDNTVMEDEERLCGTSVSDTVTLGEDSKNNEKQAESIHTQTFAARKRVKRTIIVGNISQWITSEVDEYTTESANEGGRSTHKWMAYVRGPKDSSVSHLIEKVVFYLHPSFNPHDVLEISNPPFHLKKRGWGEFPLRVKIHFKNPLNKPVDIIHCLKLPKEHPGKQVLGNETIADIYLHEDINSLREHMNDEDPSPPKRIKSEPVPLEVNCVHRADTWVAEDIKMEIDELALTSFEHDYCYADMEINLDNVKDELVESEQLSDTDVVKNELLEEQAHEKSGTYHLDHCYSLPLSGEHQYLNVCQYINSQDAGNFNQINSLSHGLGDNYITVHETSSEKELNRSNPDESQYIVGKKLTNVMAAVANKEKSLLRRQEPLLRNVFPNQTDDKSKISISKADTRLFPSQETSELAEVQIQIAPNVTERNLRVDIPRDNFKNMGEILPYLFRKMPLYKESSFKCEEIHPFMAKSFEEYCSWNIGKSLNSEWLRARTILRILKSIQFASHEKWNTRSIIMYGRSHGYTPFTYNIYNIFTKALPEKDLLITCYSHNEPNVRKFTIDSHEVESCISVDVETRDTELREQSSSSILDISDTNTKLQCSFIKHCALDCGIILKPEAMEDGILLNGAERMILEAVKSLSDNLIRRARNYVVCSQSISDNPVTVQKEHVQMAIQERREIKAILEFSIIRKNKKFFS